METSSQASFDELLAEAADWYVQYRDGLSDAQEHDFNRWKASSLQHHNAWQEIIATWGALDSVAEHLHVREVLERCKEEEKQQRRVWQKGLTSILVLCLALPVIWAFSSGNRISYWVSDYRTTRGEIDLLVLEDGSELTMNTATALSMDFSRQERRLILIQGELFIDVAPDPERPFIIETEAGTVRALGTRFTVERVAKQRLSDVTMRVAVYESRVRICASNTENCRNIKTHQQIETNSDELGNVEPIHTSEPAWLNRQLNLRDKPVVEVLTELARYHKGVLHFDSNELSHLRISGTLPLDNIPHALNAMALTLPITVDRYTDWFIVLSLKK